MARFPVGHFEFATKGHATRAIREILHTAEIDVPLADGRASLIACLYAMHPRRSGSAPAGFCVGLNSYHGNITRGFQAIGSDGSREPWSYTPCLSPNTAEPSLLKAMRGAIMLSQREALHAAYAGRALIPCLNCGAGVTFGAAHVHHLPPKFRDIADAFVGLIGLPGVQSAEEIGDEFTDLKTKRRWILFHDAVAHRVVVCRDCNAADERHDHGG